jgi:hypothetical protein
MGDDGEKQLTRNELKGMKYIWNSWRRLLLKIKRKDEYEIIVVVHPLGPFRAPCQRDTVFTASPPSSLAFDFSGM